MALTIIVLCCYAVSFMLSVAYAECLALYDEYYVLNVFMLSIHMLNVIMLGVVVPNQDPNGSHLLIITASFDDILPIFS